MLPVHLGRLSASSPGQYLDRRTELQLSPSPDNILKLQVYRPGSKVFRTGYMSSPVISRNLVSIHAKVTPGPGMEAFC